VLIGHSRTAGGHFGSMAAAMTSDINFEVHANADFKVRRWIVERLNVDLVVLVEHGKRYAIPSCLLDLPSKKLEVSNAYKGGTNRNVELVADIMSNIQHHMCFRSRKRPSQWAH
jgi:hypothetical protein